MDLRNIKKLQREYRVDKTQKMIEDGSIWKFEGSMGRFAMELLDAGVCFLGNKVTYDYYGNKIPNRQVLKDGTKGTRQNSIDFWNRVVNGDWDCIGYLFTTF